LEIAREIYARSYDRFDELCSPYASVIDIDRTALPKPAELRLWSGETFVKALRHDQSCPEYDSNIRQLLHVGYKVAAEMGALYRNAIVSNEDAVARNVAENLYARHITPLFL
jgi:hypothetical protein